LIASAPNAKTWTSNPTFNRTAAAAVCQATVKGDTLGSTTLEFIPTARLKLESTLLMWLKL